MNQMITDVSSIDIREAMRQRRDLKIQEANTEYNSVVEALDKIESILGTGQRRINSQPKSSHNEETALARVSSTGKFRPRSFSANGYGATASILNGDYGNHMTTKSMIGQKRHTKSAIYTALSFLTKKGKVKKIAGGEYELLG